MKEYNSLRSSRRIRFETIGLLLLLALAVGGVEGDCPVIDVGASGGGLRFFLTLPLAPSEGEGEPPIITPPKEPEPPTVPLTIDITERPYLLGLLPLGQVDETFTEEKQVEAFRLSAEMAEVLVVREVADWEAFLDDGTGESAIIDSMIGNIEMGKSFGMNKIYIELDVAVSRREPGPFPPALEGKHFDDPEVRQVLLRNVETIVTLLKPDFFVIGVEIDIYYEKHPDDFDNFVSVYKEAYDLIKSISPTTAVMPSFQLESLEGFFPDENDPLSNHEANWFLLDLFEPKIDYAVFTSFPSAVVQYPAWMDKDYYTRIELNTDLPIIFSELGWQTDPKFNGSEQIQMEFLSQFIRFTKGMDVRGAFWIYTYDVGKSILFDTNPGFKSMGLITTSGKKKPCFNFWKDLYGVPFVPLQR